MKENTKIRIDPENRQKLKLFSVKAGHRSMEQTIISNMEIVKQVKKAHARLKKERPDIYYQYVENIFN